MKSHSLLTQLLVREPDDDTVAAMLCDCLDELADVVPGSSSEKVERLRRIAREKRAVTRAAAVFAEGSKYRQLALNWLRYVARLPRSASFTTVVVRGGVTTIKTPARDPSAARHVWPHTTIMVSAWDVLAMMEYWTIMTEQQLRDRAHWYFNELRRR